LTWDVWRRAWWRNDRCSANYYYQRTDRSKQQKQNAKNFNFIFLEETLTCADCVIRSPSLRNNSEKDIVSPFVALVQTEPTNLPWVGPIPMSNSNSMTIQKLDVQFHFNNEKDISTDKQTTWTQITKFLINATMFNLCFQKRIFTFTFQWQERKKERKKRENAE
jgi:hypothetical protein